MTSPAKTNVVVLVLLTVLTIIVTWPLILGLNSLIIDRFDGLLITWFLNWDIHCLTSGLSAIVNCYNANIFYPFNNTLAFSETMFPQAALALPFVLLTGEPLLAYNINFILGFILTGFAVYLLCFDLTRDIKAAVFGSVLFTFSTIHLNYMAHLQLFAFWPVVFALLFLVRKKYRLFGFFFIIASLTTALNLYFLFVVAAARLVMFPQERKQLVVTAAAGGLISALFLLPHYSVSREFNYVRPITDAIHFSLQFPQLLNISPASRLSSFIPPISAGTPAFFGVVFGGLVLAMVYGLFKRIKVPAASQKSFQFFLLIALASFLLALGPALHIFENTIHVGSLQAIPLPYAILYYLLPGFSGFRTPSRWIVLTALTLCCALAIYFKNRFGPKAILLLIVLVFVEINFPFRYATVPNREHFPPEQVWLKDNYVGRPIIQFPIYNWDNSPEFGEETLREYYSTVHWHPMFNGYSGFSPKERENRVEWLQKDFPSMDSIAYLQSINIQLVLAPKAWEGRLQEFDELQLVESFPETNIYEVR